VPPARSAAARVPPSPFRISPSPLAELATSRYPVVAGCPGSRDLHQFADRLCSCLCLAAPDDLANSRRALTGGWRTRRIFDFGSAAMLSFSRVCARKMPLVPPLRVERQHEIAPWTTLLDTLRDHLDLTGTAPPLIAECPRPRPQSPRTNDGADAEQLKQLLLNSGQTYALWKRCPRTNSGSTYVLQRTILRSRLAPSFAELVSGYEQAVEGARRGPRWARRRR
jgi:hypothetical protein